MLDRVSRLEEEIVRAGALSPVVGTHPVDLEAGRGGGKGRVEPGEGGGGQGGTNKHAETDNPHTKDAGDGREGEAKREV